MGLFKDLVVPTTHTVRNDAHLKNSDTCMAPGCKKKAKMADGSCGKPGHANQRAIRSGWLK